MTRRSDPPVVLVKWYDFTKWVLGHVDNFPKNQRFVFGQRLADGVITILELIVDATYSDKKSTILLEVNRRQFAGKQYAYSSEQITVHSTLLYFQLSTIDSPTAQLLLELSNAFLLKFFHRRRA
jgi:hypothetical protein